MGKTLGCKRGSLSLHLLSVDGLWANERSYRNTRALGCGQIIHVIDRQSWHLSWQMLGQMEKNTDTLNFQRVSPSLFTS